MITLENLSKRIDQFFYSIFTLNDRLNFGFSSVVNESFREFDWDQDIRLSYDYSSTDFKEIDIDLNKWKLALSGNREIDIYIRNILNKTIPELATLTIEELIIGLNHAIISNLYKDIDLSNLTYTTKIVQDLLSRKDLIAFYEITEIRRLNKMILCDIYNLNIFQVKKYLTPRNVSTILYYKIEDNMMGNGIQSNSISYDENNLEIISSIQDVDVIVNILSKRYLAKDALNFFNFAIQSERKNNACYNKDFDFDLILYSTSSNNPINLTELEKGAWLERLQFTLRFRYLDSLKLDEVQSLKEVNNFEEIKEVYQYTNNVKEI